jgi:hypothetical protein
MSRIPLPLVPGALLGGLALFVAAATQAEGPAAAPAAQSAAASQVTTISHSSTDDPLAERVRIVERSSSSKAAREQALRGLPWDKLAAEQRRQVEDVIRNVSLYRQLPAVAYPAEPEVCRFFVEHPEVAVGIWRAMEISEFQLKPAGNGRYDARDRDGTTGTVEVLYRSADDTLAVCEGVYRGPLIKNGIRARALFHLRNESAADADGRNIVTSRLQMFVAFPSATVETVAKIVSPVSNLIIDRNFREIGAFVHLMSTAMQRQPGWIEQLSARLEGIPQAQRDELLKLTAQVYVDERKRVVAEAPAAPGRG